MKNNWETKSEMQKNTLVPSVGLLKAYAEGLIVPHYPCLTQILIKIL